MPNSRVSRNDPCPCKSGRKYKRCCLAKLEHKADADPVDRPRSNPPSSSNLTFEHIGEYGSLQNLIMDLGIPQPILQQSLDWIEKNQKELRLSISHEPGQSLSIHLRQGYGYVDTGLIQTKDEGLRSGCSSCSNVRLCVHSTALLQLAWACIHNDLQMNRMFKTSPLLQSMIAKCHEQLLLTPLFETRRKHLYGEKSGLYIQSVVLSLTGQVDPLGRPLLGSSQSTSLLKDEISWKSTSRLLAERSWIRPSVRRPEFSHYDERFSVGKTGFSLAYLLSNQEYVDNGQLEFHPLVESWSKEQFSDYIPLERSVASTAEVIRRLLAKNVDVRLSLTGVAGEQVLAPDGAGRASTFRVTSVHDIYPHSFWQWSVDRDDKNIALYFDRDHLGKNRHWIFTESWAFDPESGALSVLPLAEVCQLFREQATFSTDYSVKLAISSRKWENLYPQGKLSASTSGLLSYQAFEKLALKEKWHSLFQFLGTVDVNTQSSDVQLDLRSTGEWTFSVNREGQSLPFSLPGGLAQGFEEGLAGAMKLSHLSVAVQNNTAVRKRDLSFLKFGGLAFWLLDRLAARPAKIDPQAALRFAEDVLFAKPDLEDTRLVSTKVERALKHWVQRLGDDLAEDRTLLASNGQLLRIHGLKLASLKWFQQLWGALSPAEQTALMRKRRGPGITCSTDGLLAWNPEVLPLKRALRAGISASGQGMNVTFQGEPIQATEEADWHADFVVTKDEGAKDGAENATARERPGPLDWFELNPKIFFKGREIKIEDFGQYLREGVVSFQDRLYVIPDTQFPKLSRLLSFWRRLKGGGEEGNSSRAELSSSYYPLPRSLTLELLALKKDGQIVDSHPDWKKLEDAFSNLGSPAVDTPISPDFRGDLRPFQTVGVQWLWDLYHLGLGGILADDMGLGKTVQTICFLDGLRWKDPTTPPKCLIVVPTSLVYNWKAELSRFAPQLDVGVFDPHADTENSPSVQLITYGLMLEHEARLKELKWDIIVFDEAQNIKNLSAKRTTVARSLPARFKLCLSGTPLENHLGEFYSLLDLVVPGALGTWETFRKTFVDALHVQPSDISLLRLKSKPLVLRRSKQEILKELPDKTENRILLAFDKKQEKIYRNIALAFNKDIRDLLREQGEKKSQLHMFTALLRLRQACSHPSVISGVRYSEMPPKFERLLEALPEVLELGESALVFGQFVAVLTELQSVLLSAGIRAAVICGATPRKERERILKEFTESSTPGVLLMTLKTGGVGLNLTKASYVYHLDPWWNPAAENQATDRAHRMGQNRAVQVVRFYMRDSVEEKMDELKKRKQAQFDALFDEEEATVADAVPPSGARRALSQEDFFYLIS